MTKNQNKINFARKYLKARIHIPMGTTRYLCPINVKGCEWNVNTKTFDYWYFILYVGSKYLTA